MKYYKRADGTRCQAIQFNGKGDENTIWIIGFLTGKDIYTYWVDQEKTDQWFENEDGEAEEIIIPEHLKLVREFGLNEETGERVELGVDQCYLGDYVVERDGDYYITNKDIFEAIYEEVKI